jgi:glycosyltransferase involved in cell wall biosynthesis
LRDEANPAPAVSVILPTYNRAYCIRRAIDSVLTQTFTDFELIILDDGSTDDTESVVKSYDDPRIVFIRDAKNRGQTVRLNEGIRAARSALIAFQDSDDEWLPTKLEKQVAAMRRLPDEVGIVYTDKWRHEPGREKYHWKSPHNMPEDGIIFDRALDDAVYNIGPQSVLIRRRCFEEVGNFDERITKSNDLEMFIRISQKFRFCHIPEPLVNYFVSGDTMSATLSEGKGIGAVELILEKFRADIERNPPLLAKRAYWIGSYHMRDGDTKKGRAFLWTAVKAQPGNPRYLAGWLLSQMGRPIYRAAYRLAK